MHIFKQKSGVISKNDIWICYHDCYMYIGDSFLHLLWVVATEWNKDKNIVG